MSPAQSLIRAILAEDCPDDATALAVLEAAIEREVDPLRYCVASLGVNEALAMERAARWAGFAFYPVVPNHLRGHTTPTRLEALGAVKMFRAILFDREIAFSAPDFFGLLRLQARRLESPGLAARLCLVPDSALRDYLARAAAPALVDGARQTLARHWPYAAAQLDLTVPARNGFVGLVLVLLSLVLLAPHSDQAWLLPFWAVFLLGPAIIRMAALTTPNPQRPRSAERPDDAELPVYSVLVPLRDEAHMVPQLFEALGALRYPAEKLDIKFVVEDCSATTIEAVRRRLGDPRFSLLAVPDALPRTKPKALDFALPLCRGEFVVVYDAEDTPEPDQLWMIARRFRDAPGIECIQAQLVIDNGRENWLAGMFAAEYAGLFTVLLPALARWDLVMPLGGTSNHFRLSTLRALGGWDAFNVTEDADLGVRLARRGHRVEVMALATLEEAPVTLAAWLGQRTRWMKGWMQTLIVHNRRPRQLLADLGWRRLLVFEMLVLGMILAPLLHSGLVLLLLARLALGEPLMDGDGLWSWACLLALALGFGSAILLNIAGSLRQGQWPLLLLQLTLPAYWLLSAWAAVRALVELTGQPFKWAKTPHRRVQRRAKARDL
ncbi:MAG TPA: glycosyltransferase family 2 protein [Devosia sp.]|nr:glycosyltransferase family 2 protein [Devosia sp.]